MPREYTMECPNDGAQWVNTDVTVPCPLCQAVGNNITKMSIYKVLKALPSTVNQYEVGSTVEFTDAEVGELANEGYLELVTKVDESESEDVKKNEQESDSSGSTSSENDSTDGSATSDQSKTEPANEDADAPKE